MDFEQLRTALKDYQSGLLTDAEIEEDIRRDIADQSVGLILTAAAELFLAHWSHSERDPSGRKALIAKLPPFDGTIDDLGNFSLPEGSHI